MAGDSLEGYLFPGSYTLPRESTINDLLPQILMNFETQVNPEMRSWIYYPGFRPMPGSHSGIDCPAGSHG